MNKNTKPIIILGTISVLVFVLIFAGITITKNWGKSKQTISTENAEALLNNILKDITVNKVEARKDSVNLNDTSLADSLPSIDKSPVQVENKTSDFIEIFSSPEKAGSETDGWLVDVANDFNKSNITVNGKAVSVKIRSISSGMGMDYIVSKKYLPDAFTPSNELWGEMMISKGAKVTLADKSLVGNVPGIVLSKKKNDELVKKYGSISLKVVIEAVVNNELSMGYTNPLQSSTGLNFLVSALSAFDSKNPLSDTAKAEFEKFQANIPFVSYTTLQMRDAAASGVLDGMILEYQTYANSPDIKSSYVFTPFGYRHDNPIYQIGDLSQEKKAILNKFIEFCKQEKAQSLASKYGFNQLNDYKSEIGQVTGDTITQAQAIWKEKKNGNKDIIAVFVADRSGSMDGAPLNKLKESLLKGSQYISKDSSIGLVTYSDDVDINLPIAKFDINQRSLFTGAVKDITAGGGTSTFDAVMVATKMLLEQKASNPDAKLMLFVLSDGVTNRGHSLKDIEGILQTFKIPVYTIGYNANIDALQSLSGINEAASINADSEDVIYKLQNLFNAEM
ncbi:MAG: VWA domain-containing protein [Clostridiaceae bacterium]